MKRYLPYILFLFILITFVGSLAQPVIADESSIVVEFYFSEGCDHCQDKEDEIEEIEQIYSNNITVKKYSISIEEYEERFFDFGFKVPPGVVVLNQSNGKYDTFSYEKITLRNLEESIDYHISGNYTDDGPNITDEYCIETPFGLFCFDPKDVSLPVITIIIGALDSINPCAFFILLFLLSLLIYTRSRKRMLLIGGIFIFFSGFIYFLLMIAILFFFSAVEEQYIIGIIAGIVAIIFGALNIKDFFWFKKGPSASIPESQKPKLYKQMRKVVKITSLPALIVATIVLAITANTVELACSFVLPVVYLGILKSFALGNIENIVYLVIYNIIYIIPLFIFTMVVVITLGRWKLSEWQGRILKLFSGIMMFSLGVSLLIKPDILKNFLITIGILVTSIVISYIISFIWKKRGLDKTSN
jgi:hypothetical protein